MNSCQDAISHLQSQCPNELLKCGSAAKHWQADLTLSSQRQHISALKRHIYQRRKKQHFIQQNITCSKPVVRTLKTALKGCSKVHLLCISCRNVVSFTHTTDLGFCLFWFCLLLFGGGCLFLFVLKKRVSPTKLSSISFSSQRWLAQLM